MQLEPASRALLETVPEPMMVPAPQRLQAALALPASQWQTALALGLRPRQAFASIVWPQARRLAAPAALGVFVGAVKDTSLVMVIGLFDVLHAAKAVLADTGWRAHDLEVYGAVAVLYLLLCCPLSALARRLARDVGAG
ncbi:ABC transporter permease subunit [Curvibacter gracilis]|uniref:ABC transporter permease subunit n=1 Tax=Curvibacter gracilis TaxID=230310 RepID=UPI0004836DBB